MLRIGMRMPIAQIGVAAARRLVMFGYLRFLIGVIGDETVRSVHRVGSRPNDRGDHGSMHGT